MINQSTTETKNGKKQNVPIWLYRHHVFKEAEICICAHVYLLTLLPCNK